MNWEFAKLKVSTRSRPPQGPSEDTIADHSTSNPRDAFTSYEPPFGALKHRLLAFAKEHSTILSYAAVTAASCAVLTSLLLAIKFISGPAYTATTMIQPYLVRRDSVKEAAQPQIDEKTIVDGAIQLIGSQQLTRRVVERLNLDRDQSNSSILTAPFRIFRSNSPADRAARLDIAARDISRRIAISNPRKSLIIEVSYTAATPEQAALVANAVASEYVQFNSSTQIAKDYSHALAQLQDLTSRYSNEHPRVVSTRLDLAGKLEEMRAAERNTKLMTPEELQATGLVIPAQAVSIPSNRNTTPTIAFGIILGLLVSFAYILHREPAARDFLRRFFR